MSSITVEEFAAYLDGNLSDSEMAKIDDLVTQNPELNELVDLSDNMDQDVQDYINDSSTYEADMSMLDNADFDIPELDDYTTEEYIPEDNPNLDDSTTSENPLIELDITDKDAIIVEPDFIEAADEAPLFSMAEDESMWAETGCASESFDAFNTPDQLDDLTDSTEIFIPGE